MARTIRLWRAILCGAAALMTGTHTMAADRPAAPPSADPGAAGFSGERLARLNEAVRAQVTAGKFAGVSTLVARHGRVVEFKTFGHQDLAQKIPIAADTIYRIASMTKPVMGAALMVLYEEGKWQLDDPVSKFLPEVGGMKVLAADGKLVPQARPMTMRDLITNSGGFPGGSTSRNPAASRLYAEADLQGGTLADMVRKLAGLPLGFQPGAEFEYGISQDVQGAVVEAISGQTLDVFMQRRLFGPLGMVDTGFGVAPDKRGRMAVVYEYGPDGKLVPLGSGPASESRPMRAGLSGEKPQFLSGAGGLFSTTYDYLRFAQMLLNGGELDGVRILSPSTVKLMTSDMLPPGMKPHFAARQEGVGYGADVGVILDPGRASFNGGGMGVGSYFWTGRYGSWWWNDPVNDLIVIGMTQQSGAAAVHVGLPNPAPDLRALYRSMIYAALVEPGR